MKRNNDSTMEQGKHSTKKQDASIQDDTSNVTVIDVETVIDDVYPNDVTVIDDVDVVVIDEETDVDEES